MIKRNTAWILLDDLKSELSSTLKKRLVELHSQVESLMLEDIMMDGQLLLKKENIDGKCLLYCCGNSLLSSHQFIEVQSLLEYHRCYLWPLILLLQVIMKHHLNVKVILLSIRQQNCWAHECFGALAQVIPKEFTTLQFQHITADTKSLNTLCDELVSNDWQEQEALIADNRIFIPSLTAVTISESLSLNKEKSYIVSGGLGSLGLVTIEMLVKLGAQHIICVTKSTQDKHNAIQQLQNICPTAHLLECDIASNQFEELLHKLMQNNNLPAVGGIIHSAGHLRDSSLLLQTWPTMKSVIEPKLALLALHRQFENSNLDFFCCFSSVASVFGAAGQGAYAIGNRFMDNLMLHRNDNNKRGTSVSWGPWQLGMAGRLSQAQKQSLAMHGISLITATQGQNLLKLLLTQPTGHFIAMNTQQTTPQSTKINRHQFLDANTKPSGPVHYSTSLITTTIRDSIINTCHVDSLVNNSPLREQGVDSLQSVEIALLLAKHFGLSLPATLLFDYPTVSSIARFLSKKLHIDDELQDSSTKVR